MKRSAYTARACQRQKKVTALNPVPHLGGILNSLLSPLMRILNGNASCDPINKNIDVTQVPLPPGCCRTSNSKIINIKI